MCGCVFNREQCKGQVRCPDTWCGTDTHEDYCGLGDSYLKMSLFCFYFWSTFLWMSNSTLAAVFFLHIEYFVPLFLGFHCFFEKLCQVLWLFFWRKCVSSPLAPFKIFRLSLVLSRLSVIDFASILLVFLCDSWICELICLISFGKILSNSFFKYCFCHFLLILSFYISRHEKDNLFLAFSVLHVLQWNQCVSCLSVLHSGYFHLIFLPVFSSATSSLLSAIFTGFLILLILFFSFTWIFFWCFSSPICLNYYLF